MFNGYNEGPLIYNDFEHERGRNQQNVGKWPYGHGAGIQSHPPNQAEFWSPKTAPFLKFPNVLPISTKCTCSGCYPSNENPSGVQGDAARHRPWFHRPVTVPSNGPDDPSKVVGAHHWENLGLSQEKSCSVGESLNQGSQYLQENGEKSSFHRPYVGGRHPEPHQPGVITSAKSAEISRKEDASKRPEEIITSPSGQEILLLGQNEAGYLASSNHSKKDSADLKEKYYNPESAARGGSLPFSLEPYGKPVPFNPTQNRVPSMGHLTFKDNLSESYLDHGKSIRTNQQAQSFGDDKNCRNAFQTSDSKAAESKMEAAQNGHVKHVPSVYGNYLDYSNYGLKRDFQIACNPVGGPESQKLQYYNNKKSEYLARNYFPEAMRKTGSSLYEESKRDCMVNANSVVGIHEHYLGSMGRSNHAIAKYWESGNPKVSSCGIYYPKDSGGGPAEKRSRGGPDSYDSSHSQRSDLGGLKRDVTNPSLSRVPPHPSIYPSDPADVRYSEKEYNHPFHYQNSSSAYKNLRKAEYSAYARYGHQAHHYEYPHGANAFQMPELSNQSQYNLKSYQPSGIEQYLPHLSGGGGGGSVFEPSCQQVASASLKHYPQSLYDPNNFQPVLHSAARTDIQAQQIFTNEPGIDRTGQTGRSETGPNKISPLRLLRKKKSAAEAKNEPERVRNPTGNDGAPALDVRRFWATWAEEEDDNPPQTQMVVLDCRDIDPEQAEFLRFYDADPSRAVQLEGTDLVSVKNPVQEQRVELGGSVIDSKTDCGGDKPDAPVSSDRTVDGFIGSDSSGKITKAEENVEASLNLVKEGSKTDDSATPSTRDAAGNAPESSGAKPPKKCFNGKPKKSTVASEEVMDKWTEKKFDFLKRAEETKAAELARTEQEKKKILDGKKLCKRIPVGNKEASVSENLISEEDLSPRVVAVARSEKTPDKDDEKDSPSKSANEIDRDNSPDSIPDRNSGDLPTSEYRKNKFLDYSESEDVVRRRQENPEPAARNISEKPSENGIAGNDKLEEIQAAALPDPAITECEKERPSVPQEVMDEILEKISRIRFDGPDSSSDKSRDSTKSEKTKKPKKSSKKDKKPNHQDPKIKFSIQKFQDLKISFKIHNELPENENPERETPKITNGRRIKKRKIRPKAPVVKIKQVPYPVEEKIETENENDREKSPVILDLTKHRSPSDLNDFRVEESLDSAKIKLTIKRHFIDEFSNVTALSAENSESEDVRKSKHDDSTTVQEECSSIVVESEQFDPEEPTVPDRNECSTENKLGEETLPVCPDYFPVIIQNDPPVEKRKTVIRHSLDENVGTNDLKSGKSEEEKKELINVFDTREPEASSEPKILPSEKTDVDPDDQTRSEESREVDPAPARPSDRKRRADRDSIETRLSEMFGQDSGNDEETDRSESPAKRKDEFDLPEPVCDTYESESRDLTSEILQEIENSGENRQVVTEKDAEIGAEIRGRDDEGFEAEPEDDENISDQTGCDRRESKEQSIVKNASEEADPPEKKTEDGRPSDISESVTNPTLPNQNLPTADSKISAQENSEEVGGQLPKEIHVVNEKKIIFERKNEAPVSGRSQSLSPVRAVYLRSEKSKSVPPSTKFRSKQDKTNAESLGEDIPVRDIPLPDGDPPKENIFHFRDSSRKTEGEPEPSPTEWKLEMSIKVLDDDDSLRFPLPSPSCSDASSRSESSGEVTCSSPFVLSGFERYRNPSPPCVNGNSGEEKTKAETTTTAKHPRVDSTEKGDNLRNPSPPSSKFSSDSPLSSTFKSDSEDLFAFAEDSDCVRPEEKATMLSLEKPEGFRDDRIRTPSPLRPENRIVYGTDCSLSKESIEEGTRLSDPAPSEKDEIPGEDRKQSPDPRIRFAEGKVEEGEAGQEPSDENSFRPAPIDSEDVGGEEEHVSVDLEDAIFVTDEFYECDETDLSHPLPAVYELEEEKVSDDKFHDVMQNCLENAKKFLGVGQLKLFSCSVEDLLEIADPETEDRISRDVLLTSCEEPTGESECAPDDNFRSSELSAEFLTSFETETAHDLCPEFLPVDNWPYLEEEVPMSPAKSKVDGSEISSPPLENGPSAENPVCLFDPLKNLPDSRNVIPAYLKDKKVIFGNQTDETKEESSEPLVPGCNGLRRRSLVAEPGSLSAFSASSVRRRKTIDGITENYAATRKKPGNLFKAKTDLKCRLSLERLRLKKNDGTKEIKRKSKGNVRITEPIEMEYLSREWQPKVILSRISDRELKEKRRIKCPASCPTETGKYSPGKETLISDDIRNNNNNNSILKTSDKVGSLRNELEAEEKTRKKPRFRNLHSKKKRSSDKNEIPATDSETDSDESRPRKGTAAKRKPKDDRLKKGEKDKKSIKSSKTSMPGSDGGTKRKKPDEHSEETGIKYQEAKKKRKPEQAPQVSSTSWICEVCGFSDQTQRSLHIKTHAFHCQSCHLAFQTECRFTEHLTRRHKDIKNQHHCLLCELSFDREADHRNHLESREHKHLESVEKNTINTLFTLLTGQPCPVLGPVELKPEWLPTQAGTVHFYHQATPLSLALQYLKMRHDSCSSQPK